VKLAGFVSLFFAPRNRHIHCNQLLKLSAKDQATARFCAKKQEKMMFPKINKRAQSARTMTSAGVGPTALSSGSSPPTRCLVRRL
jgi:hypothetical protein